MERVPPPMQGCNEPSVFSKRIYESAQGNALCRPGCSLGLEFGHFLNEQRQDAAASFERPERATDTSQIPAGFSLSPKDLRFLEVLGERAGVRG